MIILELIGAYLLIGIFIAIVNTAIIYRNIKEIPKGAVDDGRYFFACLCLSSAIILIFIWPSYLYDIIQEKMDL